MKPVVRERDAPSRVNLEDSHWERVGETTQQLLACTQLLLDPDLLRSDLRHRTHHDRSLWIVETVLIHCLYPDPTAIARLITPAPGSHATRRANHVEPRRDRAGLILRMNEQR